MFARNVPAFLILAGVGCGAAAAVRQHSGPPLQNGVYAILREAPSAAQADVDRAPHTVLLYDRKYSAADRDAPPRYVSIDTALFVPLVLAGPPDTATDNNGRTLLRARLAKEHVKTLENFTRAHLGGTVAVVIDGEIVTIHKVRSVITGGDVQITRCFDNACEVLRAKLAK